MVSVTVGARARNRYTEWSGHASHMPGPFAIGKGTKMEGTTVSGYTGGEIMTMISPLFEIEPDAIIHAAIIIMTDNGTLAAIGCTHAPMLAEMVAENESRGANNTRTYNVGKERKRILRRFRR